MRDVFYTLLVVWIIWRIMNSVNVIRTKQSSPNPPPSSRKEGETTVNYVPPKKKSVADNEGEYVDYEEVK
ncbi:MAG: hypothetical protein ACXVPU_07610 [Bacteroidia bacterium]